MKAGYQGGPSSRSSPIGSSSSKGGENGFDLVAILAPDPLLKGVDNLDQEIELLGGYMVRHSTEGVHVGPFVLYWLNCFPVGYSSSLYSHVGRRLVEGMVRDMGSGKCAVDGVDASDGSLDHQVEAELVDVSGSTSGGLKHTLCGRVREERGVDVNALQMEADVVARVLEGEGTQGLRVADSTA